VRKNRRRGARPVLAVLRTVARLSAVMLVVGLGASVARRAIHWAKAHPYFALREIDVEG